MQPIAWGCSSGFRGSQGSRTITKHGVPPWAKTVWQELAVAAVLMHVIWGSISIFHVWTAQIGSQVDSLVAAPIATWL
jgi:hypothetical protein